MLSQFTRTKTMLFLIISILFASAVFTTYARPLPPTIYLIETPSQWQLSKMGTDPLPDSFDVVLDLGAVSDSEMVEGMLSGTLICNSFNGSLTLDGSESVTVDENWLSTKVYCEGEDSFFTYANSIVTVNYASPSLYFLDATGTPIFAFDQIVDDSPTAEPIPTEIPDVGICVVGAGGPCNERSSILTGDWTVTQMSGMDVPTAEEHFTIEAIIDEEGMVNLNGSLVCNSFGGTLTLLEDGTVSYGYDWFMTEAYCEGETPIHILMSSFMLETTYQTNEDETQIDIIAGDGSILLSFARSDAHFPMPPTPQPVPTATPAPDGGICVIGVDSPCNDPFPPVEEILFPSIWSELTIGGDAIEPIFYADVVVEFVTGDNDTLVGTVSGKLRCNQLTGEIVLNQQTNQVVSMELSPTEMACMEDEFTAINGLQNAVSYRIPDVTVAGSTRHMIFMDADGQENVSLELKQVIQPIVPVPPTDGGLDVVRGNINCDATVNLIDAVLIQRYNVGLLTAVDNCSDMAVASTSVIYLPACDMNRDDRCGLVDVVILLQCNAFIDNGFCVTEDAPIEIN